MSQEKTFEDIFVKQLLKDLWPKRQQVSSSNDIQDSSPAHLAYLMGEVEVLSTPSVRGQQHYSNVKLKPVPRIPHVLSEEQKRAFAFFKTYLSDFSEGFTGRELKKAFRMLARQLHPDMSESKDAGLFLSLQKAYQDLNSVFRT
ncbi:MAG: DnaJ domain-containing protein [Pseudobdellovibrionaceae bacterium]